MHRNGNTQMARKYHTLLSRDASQDGAWGAAFGDHDISSVREAWADLLGQGFDLSELRIITTDDDQGAIDREIRELNRKVGHEVCVN